MSNFLKNCLTNITYILHCIFCVYAIIFMAMITFEPNNYDQKAATSVDDNIKNKNIINERGDSVYASSGSTIVGYRYENGESVAYINGVRHVLLSESPSTYIKAESYGETTD